MTNRLPRLLLVLAIVALAPATAASAATNGPDAFTPILQTFVAPPAPVLGSDGRYHVVFEVQAVNATALPWTVQSMRIRAAGGGGRVVARWTGARVSKVLVTLAGHRPTRRLAPGQGALFFIAFSTASRRTIPARLVQELSLTNASQPLHGQPTVAQTSAPTTVVTRAPVVLGPPLEGGRWLAADGCCTAFRHVWATQPYGGKLQTAQRFAIDWERLDAGHRLFVGDKRVLTNWPGYGQPVLAVADGTVVHAVNDEPNQVPGQAPVGITPANADGNGVILRLNNGTFVTYAHMIPGSVIVRRGERVRRGQRIGLVGNSGNSTAPHLHLHVTDRNAVLGANGLPYRFDHFVVTGKVASTAAFDIAEATGQPARLAPVALGPRRDELPLDQVIVSWR